MGSNMGERLERFNKGAETTESFESKPGVLKALECKRELCCDGLTWHILAFEPDFHPFPGLPLGWRETGLLCPPTWTITRSEAASLPRDPGVSQWREGAGSFKIKD